MQSEEQLTPHKYVPKYGGAAKAAKTYFDQIDAVKKAFFTYD
ncbi:hypothetical protein [Paenibacillus alvei]|nr:hypothetical protein [Paenibacillus alvei]